VSELYTDDDPYLEGDAVFGVKPSLVVHYARIDDPAELARHRRDAPFWDLEYDIVLVRGKRTAVEFSTSREEQ
jgi:catechol 1,2-dioxygenase